MTQSYNDANKMVGRLKCASRILSSWSEDYHCRDFDMFMSKREAGDYSDAIEWAISEIDSDRTDRHGFKLIAISLAVIASILVMAIAFSGSPVNEQDCASDSGELIERKAFCPWCGFETWAMNGEIVCRNEYCESYGIPVKVQLT